MSLRVSQCLRCLGRQGTLGPMNLRTGVILTPRTAKNSPHFVYSLIDDENRPFYIGKSFEPELRLKKHVYGSGNVRVTEKLRSLKQVRMLILCDPCTEEEALELERQLIAETPGLLNQEQRPYVANPQKSNLLEMLRGASKT